MQTMIEQIVERATKMAQAHGQTIVHRSKDMKENTFNPTLCQTLLEHHHAVQPLFLKGLLEAKDSDFAHDVWGLYRCEEAFTPRYDIRFHS